jgi:hypothetical protein
MQLIDSKTRKPLVKGQRIRTNRGRPMFLEDWKEPHKPESSGFVFVSETRGGGTEMYYASVIGAEFYPRPDREEVEHDRPT